MLDHSGRAAVLHLHDAPASRRHGDERLSYVALIGRETPLSSMRRGG
jgi:hypothetical protein